MLLCHSLKIKVIHEEPIDQSQEPDSSSQDLPHFHLYSASSDSFSVMTWNVWSSRRSLVINHKNLKPNSLLPLILAMFDCNLLLALTFAS